MMDRYSVFSIALCLFLLEVEARAKTFEFTSGDYFWNDDNNWGPSPPQTFPNASGAAAVLPAPDQVGVDLSIDLGQNITIGSLEIFKPTSPNLGNTFITGANTLTIEGTTPSLVTLTNHNGTGIGTSVIDVPVLLNSTWNIDQESDQQLRLINAISGNGGLTIRRTGAGDGGRTVVLSGSNTYSGDTTLSSVAAGDDWLIVRLNNANAISPNSNLKLGNSSVLEIASGNFSRALGPAAGEVNFTGSGRNGFAAFGGDRIVNLGGAAAQVTWGSGPANFSQFVLGVTTSDSMVDFVNSINLNTAGNRQIRSYNGVGTNPIDGKISGDISGNGRIRKQNDGVLSFAGTNTYTGGTSIEDGMLRFDSDGALPASGLIEMGGGVTLGIGGDLAPGDPDAEFARYLGTIPANGDLSIIPMGTAANQVNVGFAAFGGNRRVKFNGGAMLTWNSGSFLTGMAPNTPANVTVSRNLILSDDTADGTLIFLNPIDLNGANRQLTVRNGSAEIDAEMSGVLSGTGAGLVKENTGTLVLSADNTYDGVTDIKRGRLLVNNSGPGSGTGTGDVTTAPDTTNVVLGGTGRIAGTATISSGARIAPGSLGIESLELGGLTLEAGSILEFELGTPNGTPGVNNDLLTVTGTTTINGTGAVNLIDAGGVGAGTYTLIDYAGTLAGAEVASFLSQTPIGPSGFSYSLVDTGSTVDLNVVPSTNDADFNGDGIIDAADYVVWRKFNPTTGTGTPSTGDANGDMNVDDLDYDVWFETFGSASPGGGGSGQGVPEPSTIVLLFLAATRLVRRRRVSAA